MINFYFSKFHGEINNLLRNDFKNSTSYSKLIDELDKLLNLADRLVIACQNHSEFSNINSFLFSVERSFTGSNEFDQSAQLLMNIEKWLKPILYFSNKKKWEDLNNNKHFFTLKSTVAKLQMLTEQEIDDTSDTFSDTVERYIWYSVHSRNYETHNTALSPSEQRTNYLRWAMTSILVPIYIHYDSIKLNLEGLLCNPIDNEVEDLIASIRVSRREEIKNFKARESLVKKIVGKLSNELRESGSYYLLTGIEGIGKTALCAKVSQELTKQQNDLIEPDVNIKQFAPWLPGQLIHFGKWESDPIRILRSLILQANTMLLDSETLPTYSDIQELKELSLYSSRSQLKNAVSGDGFTGYEEQLFLPKNDFTDNTRKVVTFPTNEQSIELYSEENKLLELHKETFNRVLLKLTKQYGPIVLIIDALDEITTSADNLRFLPRQLPPGVSALLTVRPHLGIETWLTNYCTTVVYSDQVGYIERNEIPYFTNIDDYSGIDERNFNDQIFHSSKGWSLQIAAITRKLKEVNGDFKQVDVEEELSKYFDRQKDEWLRAYSDKRSEYLKEILHLLSIFEPICAISLDDVQGFLEQKFKLQLDLDQIIDLLKPVSYQIQGLETAKKSIKLSIKAYAEYVKNGIGKRDLKRHLENYTNWMKDDEEIELKLISFFINYWLSEGKKKEVNIVKGIIDDLILEEEFEKLLELANFMNTSIKEDQPGFIYCIRELARLGKPQAVIHYGQLTLLRKNNKAEEKKEAELWLRKAAENNHANVLFFLGDYLIEHKNDELQQREGEQYLRKAIEQGSLESKLVLATRLIDGDGITSNTVEGYQLLEDLVEEEYDLGIIRLSLYLVTSSKQNQSKRAYQLLKSLAEEKDNVLAMFLLGDLIITGNILNNNREEGEKWLERAAERGHVESMHLLGLYKISGENVLSQNLEEGIEWLERATRYEHIESCLLLAEYYFDGTQLNKDFEKGHNWLLEAVKLRSTDAMIILGNSYLNQAGNYPQDSKEAFKWLHMAIDEGSIVACCILGEALIGGKKVAGNYKLGISFLQKAVDNEYIDAYTSLGMAYIIGDGKSKKTIEGQRILRKGIEKGSNKAKLRLAIEFALGKNIAKNLKESKNLFSELIDNKYENSLKIRCLLSLKDNYFDESVEDVQKILLKEIDKDNSEAMLLLAQFLEDGTYMPKDVNQAICMFEKLCNLEYEPAYFSYGTSLVLGQYIDKDINKGLALLDKSLKLENYKVYHIFADHYYYNENNIEKALEYYSKSYNHGYIESASNVFYLTRRDMTFINKYIEFHKLLDIMKSSDKDIDKVNYALYILATSTDARKWVEVDSIFSKLVDITAVEVWWSKLAKNHDGEGFLVLGLLLRNQKIESSNWSLEQCFSFSKDKYSIPSWIQKLRNK